LKDQGIPVPNGMVITKLEEIYECFDILLDSVTIKPLNANGGRGVTLNINNKNKLKDAYNYAMESNKGNENRIIIEKYIKGYTYRVTLVNNKFVACCKQYYKNIQNKIIGNGVDTIKDMIDSIFSYELLANAYKEYKDTELVIIDNHYYKNKYTEEYLEKHGYKLNDILPKNKELIIERQFDAYTQVYDLHKDTIECCELAARIIDIDICGLDIILENPLISIYSSGAVLEVNAGPSIGLHMNNTTNVGEKIIEYIFGSTNTSEIDPHIPIISITGDGNIQFVNNFITSFFSSIGKYVKSNNIKSYETNYETMKSILMNRKLEMGVFNNDSNVIVNEGLFYKSCNAIILGKINMTTYESNCMINEPLNSPKILRTVTTLVPKDGYAVLNMDDPNISELYNDFDGNIIYYTMNMNTYNMTNKIVTIENNNIVLYYKNIKKLLNINSNYRTSDILAAIGGIWSYYDLLNNDNFMSLQKFIDTLQTQ